MNRKTFIRIGDLIEVPDVRTVIELSETRDLDPTDPSGRAHLEDLLQSFVLTDEIKSIFHAVLGSITQGEGRGYFITGNYGSGKSHLLSTLSLIIKHTWAWNYLLIQDTDWTSVRTEIAGKRYLPVLIPLTEFGSDINLSEIVWGAIEIAAAVEGVPLSLSYTQRYINLFDRYVLPIHKQAFLEFISSTVGSEYTWSRICREDASSAHTLIRKFLLHIKEEIPFQLSSDHKKVISELFRSFRSANWDGIVIVFDELSEYLKAKPNSRSLNEDARFLQFLGESCSHYPLWIIAALQESIERTGDIQETVFKKIKDRYSQRFRLTSQHLKELVAQRLIRHKSKDATNIIRQIYSQLRNAFKRIEISEELFIQIYPVHPETLELLDKNSDLFSQRRGIVDFIASQIKGRRDENIQGILAKPADSLLTADKIFDHFSDRLATSLEYSKYYRIYKEHFEMRIAVDFPDHDDQVLAQRIVKLLILLEITPFEEIRTTRDLANMLLHKTLISDIPAADINYEHIHTNILTVLMKKTGFLKCLPGKTYLENVYRLDLKSDPSQTSDNRIKRMIQDLSPMAKEVTDSVYTTMASGLFPLALFYNRVQKREAIRWENTFRTLAVILCDFTSLEKNLLNNLRNEVLTGKIDFILLLGRYGNTEAQLLSAQQFLTREATETSTAWGFLIPTIIDDSRSLNAFLEVFACKKIIEELGNDISEQAVQTLMIIKETLNKATQNAHRIMSEGYQNGILYVSSGRYQLQGIVRITHFDQWLSSIIQTPLQLRYPEHDTVAPRMEIGSRIVPDLLLEHFITPGFLSDFKPGRDEVLQNGLNLIALPLGLARKEGTRYILTVTPRKCPAAKQIMKYIPSETVDEHLFDVPKIELESLRVKLATSKSGMSQPVFELTLAALTRKGYVSLYSKDQPLAFEHLRYPLATHLDRVSRGPLLPAKFRPAFAALYKLFSKKHLKEFDLDIQNGFWQKLLITFSKWKQELESVREMLNSMSSLYPEDQKNMVPMHEILDRFTQVCELVEQDQTACAGLQNLISHYLTSPDFENGITQIRKLISFTQVNQYPYLKARHFLNDHRLSVPSLDSYQKLNYLFENAFELQHFNYEMVFSGKLKDFLSAFQAFHSAYLQQYNSEHNAWKEQILKYDPQIVLQSSEFRVLEKLAKIRTLNFSSVVDEIKQNLYNIDQMKCTKDASILLESVPVCTCNYHLGFSPNLPQPSEIIEQAGKCIQGFLEILHTSTVSSPLDKAAEQCDKQTRNSLQSLLQLHQNQPELALMLSSLLTDNLVAFFDANMFKDQEIHHLNISMLLNVLRGQKLTAEQARIRFEEWLQGDGNIKDDDLLNIE